MAKREALPPEDDAALLRQARGAPLGEGFARLYERHHREVFGFLRRLLCDAALAEEVLQETFFRVYRGAELFQPGAPFRPWLFRIARNAALNAMRAEGKVPYEDEPPRDPPAASGAPAELAGLREEVARVRSALLAIPAETRALLLEHHHLGLRPVELAESYGCTERTIRNRLHMAGQILALAMNAHREGTA